MTLRNNEPIKDHAASLPTCHRCGKQPCECRDHGIEED